MEKLSPTELHEKYGKRIQITFRITELAYDRLQQAAELFGFRNPSQYVKAAAQPCMTLSWNYSGSQITSSWVPIQFTLSVSSVVQNVTNFSFDITITGTG
jgi:hypothetical protein